MTDHLAVLEELVKRWRSGASFMRRNHTDRDICKAQDEKDRCADELDAAIALMRGQSWLGVAPVLYGRESGADWYVDADTKTISVDVDFDPSRQLSILLKQDGTVAWSIFVQEPDSSTTKATGPSVMNEGFYQALLYITDATPPAAKQERDDA